MPVADLNGMSCATLSNKLMELKNLLTTLERNGKLSQRAVYECADKVFEYDISGYIDKTTFNGICHKQRQAGWKTFV